MGLPTFGRDHAFPRCGCAARRAGVPGRPLADSGGRRNKCGLSPAVFWLPSCRVVLIGYQGAADAAHRGARGSLRARWSASAGAYAARAAPGARTHDAGEAA